LADTEKTELVEPTELEVEPDVNAGLDKALETYRKLIDRKDLVEPLTDKEQDSLEKRIKEIEEREVVEKIEEHEAVEIPCEKNKITIGPPTLRLDKALETYRKLIDRKDLVEPLTDKEQDSLEKRIKEIEEREVVEKIEEHEAVEIPCEKNKITIGPPTLTRFEKARIMGARALQLSLGAPPFIPIPKTARISLDISMEELEQRVIPITIRRVLPNGDYQNIPIDYFEK